MRDIVGDKKSRPQSRGAAEQQWHIMHILPLHLPLLPLLLLILLLLPPLLLILIPTIPLLLYTLYTLYLNSYCVCACVCENPSMVRALN